MKNSVLRKAIPKLPRNIGETFLALLEDLKDFGPIQKNWANFSSLGENKYHCHLSRKWVACWTYEEKILTIEVYYAGSRENAPY